MSKNSSTLRRDERVGEDLSKGRWVVVRKIGEGGFAEVYEVKDTLQDEKHALKIEKVDRLHSRIGLLKAEYRTMRKLQSCPRVCRLIDGGSGTHEGRSYFVMELLGMNIAQMQRVTPGNCWSLDTVCVIGSKVLASLRGMHEMGYIHRDVKPANFAMFPRDQPAESGQWKAIDFGIARRFMGDDGSIVPERTEFKEFRGSTTYASVNAHQKQDLGRRDDLWSWLYMMVEMFDGGLPWRAERVDNKEFDAAEKEAAKEMALELKQNCIDDPNLLTSDVPCPEIFKEISHHLASLSFEAKPDYQYLEQCLATARSQHQVQQVKQPPSSVMNNLGRSPAALPWQEQNYQPQQQQQQGGNPGWQTNNLSQPPANRSQSSVNISQRPANRSQSAVNLSPPPANLSQPPSSLSQPPANTGNCPASLDQLQSAQSHAGRAANSEQQAWPANGLPTEALGQQYGGSPVHNLYKRQRSGNDISTLPDKQARLSMPPLAPTHAAPALSPLHNNMHANAHQRHVPKSLPPPVQDLWPETPLADIGRLVRQGWLSAGAVSVTETLGRLDPAEGIGVVAWLIDQLGSNRLEPASRPAVAQWLQQLSKFAGT